MSSSSQTGLKIIVVGAGIGGLAVALSLKISGHSVTVLEEAPAFAGMRIPPNGFKLLRRWGVDFSNMKKTHSNGNRFLRYSDGKVLAAMSHGVPELDYGGSYLMVHRADYHSILVKRAIEIGVKIEPAKKVVAYDWDAPSLTAADGTRYEGDLIVVADGVQSQARTQILGAELPPQDTGDIAYRILLPGYILLQDPELRDLVSRPWVNSWMGPGAHFIGYPIRGGEIYNIVACCASDTVYDAELQGMDSKISIDSNKELLRRFADWEPRVVKLCQLAGNTKYLKWRLFDLDLVERWVHPSGKAVLVGDACHPMLPYMAQGAAQATEDAAALAAALQDVQVSGLAAALKRYEEIRRPRASRIQASGRGLQKTYHLSEGKEQRERDKLIVQDTEENPIFWGSSERRNWLFAHDAAKL
ncbi:uncharacterized protein Z520_12276 [Fonsecaea multimorphosa CBS 102226]|uniref:FAD-binding domain-containing protein n=1 Tax=Fonsecaea multimorphosa CBS 102226 TaxID=1442371 RepID=A0A0D2GR58_9EURO|nr:uncharacterized protein Z520_12276 [Fonsecaea multimorphosa CBS 102226]KIX92005.1 hypothetical protein Z520_12276 [Fonsecaea multimorphosa CBS 102226]